MSDLTNDLVVPLKHETERRDTTMEFKNQRQFSKRSDKVQETDIGHAALLIPMVRPAPRHESKIA
jgi:hypothetical protein